MLSTFRNSKIYNFVLKLQTLFMCLFVSTLCLRQDLNHSCLIAALFVSLFLFDLSLLRKNYTNIILMILVYVIALISATYSSDHKEAMFVLEKQMTLIIVPIVLGFSLQITINMFRYIIYCFVVSVFFACTYLLYIFCINYAIIKDILPFQFFLNTQLHHKFSSELNLHATYLSIYVCFAIACALYILFYAKNIYKIASGLFLIVFIVSLALLSSRIIIIPFILIIVFILPFFLKKRILVIYGIILLLVGSAMVYLISNSTAFQERFKTDTLRELNIIPSEDKLFTFESITKSNDATRAERWKCAVELIREKPLIGYGTGDEKKKLEEKYIKYKLTNSSVNNFDSHNQYLAFMIKSGVFGLIAYLILLGLSLFMAIKKRNYFQLCFIVIISITSLTENILESNKGILFFVFFNSFLIYSRFLFPFDGNKIDVKNN